MLDKTQAPLARHVLFPVPSPVRGKGVLVSQTYWGNLLVGPTSRPAGEKKSNEEVLASIIDHALHLVPEIDVRAAITSFAGWRAKSDRGDFIIEESSVPRFFNIAGIDSPGLTSSPAVALEVEQLLQALSKRLGPDHAFQLRRKQYFLAERLSIVIPKTPSFKGRIDHPNPQLNIICRCERVTESEVIDCLHRPLVTPSVMAVKKRTRAGMGPCQGKFCESRVAEIIAREKNIPLEKVLPIERGSSLLPHRQVSDDDRKFLVKLAHQAHQSTIKPKL